MTIRRTLFALAVSLVAGCAAQPDAAEVPADHPANPAAAEAPAPPSSQTLALPALAAAAPPAAPTTSPGPAVTGAAAGGATVYTCPHHPEVTSDRPGECPKCHMKLRPKASPPGAPATTPHDADGHGGSHEADGGHGGAHP